ncbi:MAG: hypothetical protein KAJ62_12105 [Desulfobacteraceae bacterium]|nr:hypothetical protein [Desulfobacteraceae bacterium]
MGKKTKKKTGKKIDIERKQAFESLPPNIKQRLTDEEKELFLNAEEWPDSLFDKLKEFIIT